MRRNTEELSEPAHGRLRRAQAESQENHCFNIFHVGVFQSKSAQLNISAVDAGVWLIQGLLFGSQNKAS